VPAIMGHKRWEVSRPRGGAKGERDLDER
jgi:hypothetical protein